MQASPQVNVLLLPRSVNWEILMAIIDKDEDRYDAFFSYALADAVYLSNWHYRFYQKLENMYPASIQMKADKHPILKNLKDRQPKFFWDKQGLPANGDILESLKKALGQSEFLFVFIGQGYLNSTWCGKEMEIFVEKLKNQGKDEKQIFSRLFIIVLNNAVEKKKSWGNDFLDKAKEVAKWNTFVKDNELIPTSLDDGGCAVVNENFDKILRRLSDTLAVRTAEILSEPVKITGKPSPSSTHQTVSGVTIGLVSPRLENATAELEKNLQESGFTVERITSEDLNVSNKIQAYLSKSALFIQPFDFGEVQFSLAAEGGHLKLQENIIQKSKPDLLKVYWQVPSELGGIEEIDSENEDLKTHTPYLIAIAKSQTALKGSVNEVVEYILEQVGTKRVSQGAAVPTVYIESTKIDEVTMYSLTKMLEKLWKEIYGKASLECIPIPWSLLDNDKQDTLKDMHGIIMMYGNKTQDAVVAQIKKLNQKTLYCTIKPGRAVAWAPPNQPRKDPIGYPINFDCEMTEEADLKNAKNFLSEVCNSFRSSTNENHVES